jgi:hypothetical protein
MADRKNLTDILAGNHGGGDWINGNWGDIAPAPEFGPIPSGAYVAHLTENRPDTARTGTPTVKLVYTICEGEYKGRHLWYDVWLTGKNRANAVRDFAKLGIHGKEQIDSPLPTDKRIRCKLDVKLRRNDSGAQYNEVRTSLDCTRRIRERQSHLDPSPGRG